MVKKRFKYLALLSMVICIVTLVFNLIMQNQKTDSNAKKSLISMFAQTDSQIDKILNAKEISQEESMSILSIDADSILNLDSVEKISELSEVMVKGEVIETNSFTINNNFEPQAITLVKVRIAKDYRDKLQAGKEAYFIQHGGIVKVKDLQLPLKATDSQNLSLDNEKYCKVVLNHVEVSNIGDQILFFAVPIQDNFYQLPLDGIYYETVGDYQGRFKLDETGNKFIRIEPNIENIASDSSKKSKSYENSELSIVISNDDRELNEIAEKW